MRLLTRVKGETGRGRGAEGKAFTSEILGQEFWEGVKESLSGLSQLTNSSGDFVVLLFLS